MKAVTTSKTSSKTITRVCLECNGSGEISACCQDYIDAGRCGICGRFSKAEVCTDCDGHGILTYGVGDAVQIFVCVWSPEYLKKLLDEPKKVGEVARTYDAVITEIIDDSHVEVRIDKNKKKMVLGIEDIQIL